MNNLWIDIENKGLNLNYNNLIKTNTYIYWNVYLVSTVKAA
jgi:hypothetical protein